MTTSKKGRGAPPKNGVRTGDVLIKILFTLAYYQEARLNGKTDRSSKYIAIQNLSKNIGMTINKTELEKSLAEFQPSHIRNKGLSVLSFELANEYAGSVGFKPVCYECQTKPHYIHF